MDVPRSFDEITALWLDGALRSAAPGDRPAVDATVAAVAVEPLGASVGLLGDLARLRVDYERGTGPATMIVKLPTTDPGGHEVGAMLRAWAREVAFYTEVAPASPGARVPRCYAALGDDDAERWVVVLEDCPAQPIDASVGASADVAAAAVDALAAFHARWWERGPRFAWMPGFDTTGVGGLRSAWLDALPRFFDRYHHVVPSPTDEWIRAFASRLGAWSDRAGTEPLTVVHADYRLDNLLVWGSSVTMVDWQTALRGPGAMDLSSFCLTGLTVADRRTAEAGLIDRYLAGLAAGGVQVDREWFVRSYDETILWWMGQFANNLARLEPAEAETQLALDAMIERTYTAGLDRNVGRLLD